MAFQQNSAYTVALHCFLDSASIFKRIALVIVRRETQNLDSSKIKEIFVVELHNALDRTREWEPTKLLYASKNPLSQAMARL